MARYKDNLRQCPKCHEEFYPGECDVVATFPVVPPGADLEVLEPAPRSGWRRELARMNPTPLKGNRFVNRLARRRCPVCGYLLPPNIDRVPTVNVAVVGNYNSGKSHYIASLIQQLHQGLMQASTKYARFVSVTTDVENFYHNNYIIPLYNNQQMLPNTQPLYTGYVGFQNEPLIYELTVKISEEYLAKSINLVIHDAAGEDYASPEKIVEFTRHVLNAKALIYLADPLEIPKIAKEMPSYIVRPTQASSPSAMLNKIEMLMEQLKGTRPGMGLQGIPVAVTLSKSDLLKKLRPISQAYNIFTNPSYGYSGGIDFDDLDIVNREVQEILNKFEGHSLLQAIGQSQKARFFAVSATGEPPDASGIYAKVEPIRCLDPFLWILHQMELVPENS
jgi:hypothetical protein